MRRLDSKTRAQVIHCLIEGCSIRSTVRMTGVAKKTVMRVLVEVGAVCADYQDKVFRNLRTQRLQLDEMWGWIFCKEKNRTEEIAKAHPDSGDVWLWVAIDADTKLVPSWMLRQQPPSLTIWLHVYGTARRSQPTDTGPILKRLKMLLEWKLTIRYCRKSTVLRWRTKRATRQQSASESTFATSAEIRMRSTFPPATLSGRTGRFAGRCAATLAYPMGSPAHYGITRLLRLSTISPTTSSRFIPHFAPVQLRRQASQTSCGT